jgi:hypothetical protein
MVERHPEMFSISITPTEEEGSRPPSKFKRRPSPNGQTHEEFMNGLIDQLKTAGRTEFYGREMTKKFKAAGRNGNSASPAIDKVKQAGRVRKKDPTNRLGPWLIVK